MRDDDTLDLFEAAEAEAEASKRRENGQVREAPAEAEEEATKPAEEAPKPAEGATKPTEGATKPTEGATEASAEATEPTSEAEAPAEEEAGDTAESGPRVWQVSEINRAVRAFLRESFPPLWVGGEVANWKRARSGHCYFTLRDEHAQLRCVMWRGEAARLPIDPEEGMRVRAFGSLDLYEVRGEYQLQVRNLEGEGEEGLWKLAFEKLRRRLEGEGLLATERKRALPRFPTTVGLVTSTSGAAIRDILSVLRRRAPWVEVVVRGCRVQGEGASEEVASALRLLARTARPDVLIVGRGGGSIEDLWAFNEEPVARAIADCPVPVVSAVGHETDVTISDLVADLRAPTPSAAAEAVVRDRSELQEALAALTPRLGRALKRSVERRDHRLRDLRGRLERGIRGRMEPASVALERRGERLERGMRSLLELRRGRLESLAGKVDALSPMGTLRRGYAVAQGEGGRVLCRGEHFEPGSAFELRVVDARVPARVDGEPRPEPEEAGGSGAAAAGGTQEECS